MGTTMAVSAKNGVPRLHPCGSVKIVGPTVKVRGIFDNTRLDMYAPQPSKKT